MTVDRATPTFVSLASATARRAGAGGAPCQGLYWTAGGSRPPVAVIATHYNVDFAEHYLAPYLASRGVGFLGWNTRYRGAEDLFILEHALIDIGEGVRWLRTEADVEAVVLLGNSGGGSLMAAYQAAAAGDRYWGDLGARATAALENLPSANLYISLNAHPGRPEVLTAWMDPSVTDETDPASRDPELDPFDPRNGPPYSQAFIARYRDAQRERNQRITDWAKAELTRLETAGVPDRVFPLFRVWADLRFMDATIDPSDRISPGCYAGDPAAVNRGPVGIGRASTLKTWLSMWSLETSTCKGADRLRKVALPSLVVQSLGDQGVFPSDARSIFEALAASDKSLEFLPGRHYFEDDEPARARVADLLTDWIRSRL
jgi:hypothetical protein